MSQAAKQVIGKVGQAAAKVSEKGSSPLNKSAKKDPELYVLAAVMSGVFGLAGWYFGGKQTSSSSEAVTSMVEGTMPWQTAHKDASPSEHFKYKYRPGGDPNKPLKDAPSALNSVIVPNVTLSKKAHDMYNKYGKDGY